MEIITNPTLKEASNMIEQAIRDRNVIVVFGTCVVSYEGRAASYLDRGPRLIVIKRDRSILVHQSTKREPINWQPPGATILCSMKENNLRLFSRRSRPPESLEIKLMDIKMIAAFDFRDETELELRGTEEDMVQALLDDPDLIESGFKPHQKETETRFGFIDIFGEDKDGNPAIVEVKRGTVGPQAIIQLKRYVEISKKKVEKPNLRAIIVAPNLTPKAKQMLRKYGYEFRKIDPMRLGKVVPKLQRRLTEWEEME